ncbi:MAG: DEAD/DEAH box helicase [Alphaproteobacteria bacterium]|nr:DEAD/DEAH box helicase [Alphaproteobacteria bacterium]
MSFSVGSLVTARGREWVVLPDSEPHNDLLVLRPLGGSDDEIAGIYLPLETVEPAEFSLPDPERELGSHDDGGLLRDAVRLGFRAGAGPFRSLARIAVEPRPYQLVPLLMALRQDPVRLLVADDVGIGKTVESLLIARELLDRGEIRRVAVLCPPHLAEQWQRAMHQQFHLEAALVLPGTARRLERGLAPGESLFDRHPHVVVSMDWIKSERRRHEFLRVCPELVIVDEAHTCTAGAGAGRSSQQRHDLVRALSRDPARHLLLVTATPHSGKEENFRSLLGLLDNGLVELPEDLSGEPNRKHREHLARFLVQRRRGDLSAFLDVETPFPDREQAEEHYSLSKPYRRFLERVLDWCREQVLDKALDERHQRVRWWSAVALLRAIGSSPAAAAATLRNRAASAEADTVAEADEVGRRLVMDLDDEVAEGIDVVPGSQSEDEASPDAERLRRLAREADGLKGAEDNKLQKMADLTKTLVKDGWSPILFCRFIPTVEYVAEHLRKVLPGDVHVEAVTGDLPPDERESRIEAMRDKPRRVLVCTDCLSEGINLQDAFDAVVHYDLAWNPTRHEQREGRVDRYGQPRDVVRTLTFYGRDNPVDGMILDVLIRKHRSIHKQLGITVPVPMDSNAVVEAMMENLLLRRKEEAAEQLLLGFAIPNRRELEVQWDAAADRERRSRTLFAQASIKVEEVARELAATRAALGAAADVERFVREALRRLGAHVADGTPARVSLAGTPSALRDAIGRDGELTVAFEQPAPRRAEVLGRTHPVVAGLSSHVLEAALDPLGVGAGHSPARRCGVSLTTAVSERTVLLLLRLRFHIVARGADGAERELLAEDAVLAAFTGLPSAPNWLTEDDAERLLGCEPAGNLGDDLKRHHLGRVLARWSDLEPHLHEVASRRGDELLDAHRRVRKAGGLQLRSLRVEPHLPPDVLGLFVLMPGEGA